MQTHDLVSFLNLFAQPVNFISHLVIFLGAFYILLHNRNMPKWHVTPLWWAGCASFFTFITIVLGLYFGDEFVFSYHRMGYVGEVAFNTCVASIAAVFLIKTVKADIRGRQYRDQHKMLRRKNTLK